MCKESLISELRAEINQLKTDLENAKTELNIWEKNGVLLTNTEKQCFYTRYRKEWREKRQEDRKRAARELERLSTHIWNRGGNSHEKGI